MAARLARRSWHVEAIAIFPSPFCLASSRLPLLLYKRVFVTINEREPILRKTVGTGFSKNLRTSGYDLSCIFAKVAREDQRSFATILESVFPTRSRDPRKVEIVLHLPNGTVSRKFFVSEIIFRFFFRNSLNNYINILYFYIIFIKIILILNYKKCFLD